MTKESVFEQIRIAGYNYAKEYYDKWSEYFIDAYDEDSPYKDSLDENGCPKEECLSEQIGEQCWQNYYWDSPNNESFCKENNIAITASIAREIEDEDLFPIIWEGVEKFIEETYPQQ